MHALVPNCEDALVFRRWPRYVRSYSKSGAKADIRAVCTTAKLGFRCPLRVKVRSPTARQGLPVHPHERTSSNLFDNRVGACKRF